MAKSKGARKKPARWRSVRIKIFGHPSGWRHELWRGDVHLATVGEQHSSTRFDRRYYWHSSLGEGRAGKRVELPPGTKLDAAKQSASKWAKAKEIVG